ncbi:MAG: hypothetical protein KBF62_03445 [Candidatus Pacebacteria bacterium]|nr:hypothetical protein [Candidatus Paceibacterota bacterium]
MKNFELQNQPHIVESSSGEVGEPVVREVLERNPALAKIYSERSSSAEVTLNESGKIVSQGEIYDDTPRIRALVKLANAIRKSLPRVSEGHIRLWRGNRPEEVGHNPSYTSSLEGIALFYLGAYGGVLSYIDIPQEDLEKYPHGPAATESEFLLPSDLVRGATIVGFTPEQALEIKKNARPLAKRKDNNPWAGGSF